MPLSFSAPVPFAAAAESRAIKTTLPTTLSSYEIDQISAEILERAMFSARVSNAEILQKLSDVIDRFNRGELNLAQARGEMKAFLRSIGYQADAVDVGTIKDLSTTARIDLQLWMGQQSAAGYGHWVSRQRQPILDQWPCDELLRVGWRRTHRQWSGLDDFNIIRDEPLEGRWQEHGGQLYDGRMIALANDPIWVAINRFGVPYEPFDFNSGMGKQAVNRQTCFKLGVIDEKNVPFQTPQTRDFNQDLKFTTAIREAFLRQALEAEGYSFDGDVLTL